MKKRTLLLLAAVPIAAALLFVATACETNAGGGDPDEGQAGAGSSDEATTAATEEAEQTSAGSPPGAGLPEGTLSFGGQSVAGETLSACWRNGCVDGPPRLPQEPLIAPEGSALELGFGGGDPLASVSATATPVEVWGTPAHPRTELQATQEEPVLIFAELPPGDYVFNVYYKVVFEETGHEATAPYMFRVLVQ